MELLRRKVGAWSMLRSLRRIQHPVAIGSLAHLRFRTMHGKCILRLSVRGVLNQQLLSIALWGANVPVIRHAKLALTQFWCSSVYSAPISLA